MNDDERTILDTESFENNAQNNNEAELNSESKTKTKNAGIGEKAAYAAGGAVFGAGTVLAGQAMAAPSTEMPVEAAVEPEAEEKEQETGEKEAAETTNSEVETEAKATAEEASGVTVETSGTTVHVTGNANIDINDGNVHVSTGAGQSAESSSTEEPTNHNDPATGSSYHTTMVRESYQPAPEPEDAIVATATGVRVAQVDDDSSFSQAFADARAQVGPGGIFEWHGRVYATYYKDEWDNMSAAERHDFQAHIDYNDVLTDDSMAQHHNDIAHHHTPTHHDDSNYHTPAPHDDSNYQTTAQHAPEPEAASYDDEVHVLEVAQTDLNSDGIPEDVALLEVNGHEIVIVDIDRDGIADIAVADVDGDGEYEYGDISGEGIGMPGMSDGDMYIANNDAPDYMNDANVDNYMA